MTERESQVAGVVALVRASVGADLERFLGRVATPELMREVDDVVRRKVAALSLIADELVEHEAPEP